MMIFKNAKISDLDEIVKLKDAVKKSIKDERLDIWQEDYPTKELLKDDIIKGYARIVLIDDEVVGYIALIPTEEDYGPGFYGDTSLLSYSRLMTSPSHRGKGIAKNMIVSAIKEAREKGYDGMGIAVDDVNHRAIGLYRSFGFEKAGSIDIPEAKNTLDKYVLIFDDGK